VAALAGAAMSPRRMLPCIHFTGIQNDTCKVGVNYRELAGKPDHGMALRLPCISLALGEKAEKVTCAKQHRETEPEAAAREAAADAAVERVISVLPIISAFKRTVPKGRGHAGTIECPVCNGTLHVTIAPSNHHASVKCETEKCVSFIE
jgi:hypothetical protein